MGFRGKWANKRDTNEAEIIGAFQAHGVTVLRADKPVDLICGWGKQTFLVEVKMEGKPLTPAQSEFFASWPGHAVVVRSVDDVAELVAGWKR